MSRLSYRFYSFFLFFYDLRDSLLATINSEFQRVFGAFVINNSYINYYRLLTAEKLKVFMLFTFI